MAQRFLVRALLGAMLFMFLTAGCCVGPPAPVDGTWRLERTVISSSPGCKPPRLPDLVITVYSDAGDFTLEVPGVDIERKVLAETSVSFVSQEWNGDEARTLLIAHELGPDSQQDRLTGTAQAWGDGADSGCRHLIDVVGTPGWE